MNIAIDLTAIDFTHYNGIRHYSLSLIEALSNIDKKNNYFLFSFIPLYFKLPKNFSTILVKKKYPFLNRELQVIRELNKRVFDVIHFPATFAPYLFHQHSKIILTVHDTQIFLDNKKFSLASLQKNLHILRLRKHIKNSAAIVCDSYFIKKELNDHFNRKKNIYVVSPGISTRFVALKKVQRRNKIICFADTETRKNISFSIEVFAQFRKIFPSFKLIIITPQQNQINLLTSITDNTLRDALSIRSNIAEKQLIELYQEAFCLFFPSRYEGFGLPLLEAMACGCPIISSKQKALQEIGKSACLYLSCLTVTEGVKQLRRLKENNTLYATMQSRGIKQATKFSWKSTAKQVMHLYKGIYKQSLV